MGAHSDMGDPVNTDENSPQADEETQTKTAKSDTSVIAVEEPEVTQDEEQSIVLFGINLSCMSPTSRFLVLSTMLFVFYLIYGYIGELMFRLEGFKPFGWYLTLIQFALTALFGYAEQRCDSKTERKIPIRTHCIIAFLTVASMGLANSSMGYLNYPTHVIFKCCKLIPVLIGSILIQGKRHPLTDWIACGLMSIGLVFFSLADNSLQPNFNLYGIVIVLLSLVADAIIGNVQEISMRECAAPHIEVIVYSYAIGFVFILVGQVLTGQIINAFIFCQAYPLKTYGFIVIFSVAGYLGLKTILTLLQTSGALVTVIVTTLRKAVTIVISFIVFAKPFSFQYVWSGSIILLGIYIQTRYRAT